VTRPISAVTAPGLKQPLDCGAADAVTEVTQLALDPNVAPGRVLVREPSDQIGEFAVHAGPAAMVGVGPFLAISRRCQVNTVAGVTSRQVCNCLGSSRINAARTARSGQDKRGFGCCRRRIATSWRRTRISAFLAAVVRVSSISQSSTRQKVRYSKRRDTVDHHSSTDLPHVAAVQRRNGGKEAPIGRPPRNLPSIAAWADIAERTRILIWLRSPLLMPP